MKGRRLLNYIPMTLGLVWAVATPYIYTKPILAILGGLGGAIAGFCLTVFLEIWEMC